MEFTIAQLASMLDGTVEGNGQQKINMLAKIQEAKSQQISFLSNLKYEDYLYTTSATAVIVSKDFSPKKPFTTTLIRVSDPYIAFSTILEEYQKVFNDQKSGVEQPCFIGQNTTIGDDIYIGAFSYISNNVKVGNNVKIHPHTYIGDNSTIGDNTVIQAGVKLYPNTKLGSNCILHAGAVIGGDGFGFAPQKDGTYKTIPQLGNVIIEDNVHIGSNTVIDCAVLPSESTIIGKGTKLDNLIQIAHNVKIGENTVIAALTGVSGSVEIGDNCVISGQVGINGHLKVANKTSIGGQSGIMKNVEKEGKKLLGTPAIDVSKQFRNYAYFKNLAELNNRLRHLEEKVLNLPAK